MKNSVHRFLPLLLLTVLTYTGCAKQQAVRTDDSIAPAASAAQLDQTASRPATVAQAAEKPPVDAAAVPVLEQDIVAERSAATAGATELQHQLEAVYFDFDSSVLSESARLTLAKNAAVLKASPLAKVRIEGNCDERGSDEYNLAIGERRAQAAARYLEALGIAAGRLSSLSYGKEKPAVPGHDEASWSKNRRDEFVVIR